MRFWSGAANIAFNLPCCTSRSGRTIEKKKRCKQQKRRGRAEEKEINSGTGAVGAGGRVSLTIEMETEGGDE